MTKILYIGHYKEGTGWGHGCLDYLMALDSNPNLDVVARSIKLNDWQTELPEKVKELEAKDSSGCTVCIQHVLPHYMEYNGNFDKNIGMFYYETSSIKRTPWLSHLNLMDELWVPNQQMAEMCIRETSVNKVKVVPQPTDTNKYKGNYTPIDNEEINDNFVFYYIGEFNKRKRLSSIIRAFHTEFSYHDNARLLIKTSIPGKSAEETFKYLSQMEEEIKRELKIYKDNNRYQPIIFITERMNETGIMSLHNSSDCFVTGSFGEAWCIPAFDAMGFNNYVIAPDSGGPADFLKGYPKGYLVEGQWIPTFAGNPAIDGLETAKQNWFDVNLGSLGKAMRDAYDFHSTNNELPPKCYISTFTFPTTDWGYTAIGERIGELCQ